MGDKRIVSALQIGPSKEGTSATIKKILSYENEIKESGTSLVVIPEATVGGYPIAVSYTHLTLPTICSV